MATIATPACSDQIAFRWNDDLEIIRLEAVNPPEILLRSLARPWPVPVLSDAPPDGSAQRPKSRKSRNPVAIRATPIGVTETRPKGPTF